MRIILLIFIIVPIVEMWLLIQVGGMIGALPTIAAVLLTAMVGLSLLRNQGLHTLLRLRQRVEVGEMPAQEMLEGIILAVSGALLLTPGFFTDAIGFVGLIPVLRQRLIRRLMRRVQVFDAGVPPGRGGEGNKVRGGGKGTILEGECWHEDK